MKINNISFAFDKKVIFDNFSLEIPTGVSCLMGPSGSGKTTLLKLIAGLLPLQEGFILPPPKIISFMFQEDRLFPQLTAFENVKLVTEDTALAKHLLKALEVYESLKPANLSGGMARRVALARALAYESDMLLLDEPFKGLDKRLIKIASSLILAQKKDAIITTHSDFERDILGGSLLLIN